MLNFGSEEWAGLLANPIFIKFLSQIRLETKKVKDLIGEGTLLSNDPNAVAIQYSANVGRILALTEILEYKPEDNNV